MRNQSVTILLGWAALSVSHAVAADPAALTAAQVEQIERVVAATMTEQRLPAMSVAVGVGGKLVWSAGFGKADLENDVPASAETRYRTASVTKWMTATAALRLVELGRLNLDASPQSYCKSYPVKQWPMTVRQLLNHTAGVRHYRGDNDEPQDTAEQRAALAKLIEREEAGWYRRYTEAVTPVAVFADDPLLFRPGTKYNYSSFGYRLLGCVLENAAGESYRRWMHDAVFDPAGMSSMVEDDAWAIVPHRVSGYGMSEDGKLRRAQFRDFSENLPAGAYLSTAADLVRFALAFDAGRLINANSVGQMLAPPNLPQESPESYYGLGVRVWDLKEPAALRGKKLLTHSGGQNGTSTYLLLLPESHLAVAVMANRDDVDLANTGRAIVVTALSR